MPAHCIVPRIKMTEMFMAVMFFFFIYFLLIFSRFVYSALILVRLSFENVASSKIESKKKKKNPSNMIEINALHRFVTDELRCAHNSVIQISVSKTKSA